MGWVDLHSHVLPGLDDGAPDADTSMAMLQGLVALGFDTICATPHQKSGQYLPALEDIAQAHQATVEMLSRSSVDVALPLAAENMWDEVFFERFEADAIPSYGDGPAFLVEFRPSYLPAGLTEHLFRLRARGKLPVIAHPERYEPLWHSPDLVEVLAAECAMVVDLGALAGHHGRKRNKAARKLVDRGMVHAVASDAHSPADVRIAAEGIAWLRKRHGDDTVTRLLDTNPRRILAGEHPEG